MPSLAERVADLPPELFNIICDLALTVDPSEVHVTSTYKPPACLQLSHHTREAYARAYYTRTVFYVDEEHLFPWWDSLSNEHTRLVKKIRIEGTVIDAQNMRLWDLEGELLSAALSLRKRFIGYHFVLQFKVTCGEEGKTRWLTWFDGALLTILYTRRDRYINVRV